MQVLCSACGASVEIGDGTLGEATNCPHCGEFVRPADTAAAARRVPQPATAPAEGARTCPMCGASVPPGAARCEACGEVQTGLDHSSGDVAQGLWHDGSQLVMTRDAQLPYVCIKCNEQPERWFKRKIYWHHPALFLLILISVWLYVIVALIVRKKAEVQVALCRNCQGRRRFAITVAWLGVLLSLGMIVGGIVIVANDEVWGLVPLLLGVLALLAAAIFGGRRGAMLRVGRITDRYIWLKEIDRKLLASLPGFDGMS